MEPRADFCRGSAKARDGVRAYGVKSQSGGRPPHSKTLPRNALASWTAMPRSGLLTAQPFCGARKAGSAAALCRFGRRRQPLHRPGERFAGPGHAPGEVRKR